MRQPLVVLTLLAAVVAAGCSASGSNSSTMTQQSVGGGSGNTGGSVLAGAPSVLAFAADKSSVDNSGAGVVTFSGSAFSPNGEANLASLAIAAAGTTIASTHAITASDIAATSEPASFGADGWKVWDPQLRGGALAFKAQVTIPAFTTAGSYGFVLGTLDRANATAASNAVSVAVTKFSLVTVASAPVDASGAAQPGQAWGGWSAAPGATNVNATNYLKLTNDGDKAATSVVISFSSSNFTGATDRNYTIPINGHIQFAWAEGAPGAIPSALSFAFGATSASGSVTVNFQNKGDVAYVTYRMTDLPAVLAKQSYSAAFTVTEI